MPLSTHRLRMRQSYRLRLRQSRIYVSRRLKLDCGLILSNSCIEMKKIVEDHPSDWSTSINQLNDVNLSTKERTNVEQQMIASGREYRQTYGERFFTEEAVE